MEWTCTVCGEATTAEAVGLLVEKGWWITELGRGRCPACVRKEALREHARSLKQARARTSSSEVSAPLGVPGATPARSPRRTAPQ